MERLKRKYIVDEENKRIGVQLDIETFNKIEEILENHGLIKLIEEVSKDEVLTVKEAKQFYKELNKEN